MRKPVAYALLILALTPAAAGAQSAKGVRIDFRALTEDGQQVGDLKPEEVTLKVNGKPRQIQSLNVFHTAGGAAAKSSAPLPAPYASNAIGRNGRIIHLIIDDESISPGRETQLKEAVRLMTSELAPGDRIGVLTPQGQVNISPGDDHGRVRFAVDAMVGRAPNNETDMDSQCRTVKVLAGVSTVLGLAINTPTTIVVFAGGLTPPAVKQIAMGATNRTSVGGREADPRSVNDVCRVEPDTYQNIGALAATARADLYLFHMSEAWSGRSTTQDAGFESLAGVTGGEYFKVTASPQSAISRLLRETAAYYTATFEPEANERNGQALRVELKASRDKVKLRSRPSVQMPKADTGKASGAPAPKDMLRTSAEYHDLPLRASAYTSRMPGTEELRIVTMFESPDGGALSAASVGLFDEKNTLRKQWTAQKDDLAKRPIRADLQAPAGNYRVRVAATDASGRAGTADYELQALIARADPLKLSALVLGTQQQGGGFAPRLEFTSEPIAIGLLEIYGVPKGATLTVDLDVAQAADGAPIATAPTQIGNGSSGEDSRMAFGGFSIASLAPGDYLMRATVSLDGKPVGRVTRTLRKAQ